MISIILDTNIIYSYANYLERFHQQCRNLFNKSFQFLTCNRVITELNIILSRRDRLYKNISKLIKNNRDLRDIFKGVQLNVNDKRDLERVIIWLNNVTEDKLFAIRRFNRLLKRGIEDAKNKIDKPYISRSNDIMFFQSIKLIIEKDVDSWIIVDSFCWCEKNYNAYLSSTDFNDIILKRDEIEMVCLRCRPLIDDPPLRILTVSELLAIN